MPDTPILGPGRTSITLEVNGQKHPLEVFPSQTLAEVLRDQLGLTGTKIVCGMGNCGACTVALEGVPIYACLMLAVDCEGRTITTIEGLSQDGHLHPVQQAFIAEDAAQCGYCTSGQVISMALFLEKNPQADAEAIRHAASGNLCRCGTYVKIVRAGLRAAEVMRQTQDKDF